MIQHRFKYGRLQRGSLIVLLLLVLGILSLALARPVQTAADEEHSADVTVSIWPVPNILVTPGSTIAYEIHATNYGDADASKVHVYMPYNPEHLTVLDSRFVNSDDWVSEIGRNHLRVQFGRLDEDESRIATIYMRVNDTLSPGTIINMWAGFDWTDERGTTSAKSSNGAPVIVGTVNETCSCVWMAVEPAHGPLGTTFSFFSDRFVPDEKVATWLNVPGGVKDIGLSRKADDYGRVWLEFSSNELAPGTYQLVAAGTHSKLTAVATFVVEP